MAVSLGGYWKHRQRSLTVAVLALAFILPHLASASENDHFFEAKVRPLLVDHCFNCHSVAKGKAKGGLRLDSRKGILEGGERGLAIVPGKPDESLLIKAVRRHDPDLQMPPDKALTSGQIATLETWIRNGAEYPVSPSAAPQKNAAPHWAFQPIHEPRIPDSASSNPIDALIAAKLESKGLKPSTRADKRTLIRRAYFDLIGLPPTWEQVNDFERDESPLAFEKVVDQLLASPHYGERWGRHWLDVARYADTKDGVLMYGEDRIRPFAYTYRDYVIRAFNADVPFDRIIHEQLAADMIEPAVEPWRLAALGFLTLGRMYDGNIHDVIDDRIDTMSRGLLGLTVSCARCHDHKFDPIPTTDYYSLYGVFTSCEQPLVLPQLDPEQRGPAEFEKKYAAKKQQIERMLDEQYYLLSRTMRAQTADYLVRVATTPPDPMETAVVFFSLDPDSVRLPLVAQWRRYIATHSSPDDPIFGIWHELIALPDADFEQKAGIILNKWQNDNRQVNQLVVEALRRVPPRNKADVARVYGNLLAHVWEESRAAAESMGDDWDQLLAVMSGPESPMYFPKSKTQPFMARAASDAFGKLNLELDKLAVNEPAAPPRAMVVFDSLVSIEPRVLVRGNPGRLGDFVPRQFLGAIAGPNRRPFTKGSGRLELAKAITDRDNPVTARVFVNRVWMHHFGQPLVDTPSDFGLRCGKPVQSELLDHLAASFRNDGWSLKALHRRIMLTATYQQSSRDRTECRQTDPENRLLWRMNRQRLDFEPMRDTMLAVSGSLDRTLGGRPVDVAGDPQNKRRTVYGMVDRQSIPGVFRAFDFASPDQSVERRSQTTVPQQALFGLNGSFVMVQAERLINRPEVQSALEPADRIRSLYRIILQRNPDSDELRLSLEFLDRSAESDPKSKLSRWEQLAHVLLLTSELQYVD